MPETIDPPLEAIRDDVLRQMYAEAEPPLDWSEVVNNPDEYQYDFYEQHHLPSERQAEILDEAFEKYSPTSREKTELRMSCIVDLGPTGVPLADETTDSSESGDT